MVVTVETKCKQDLQVFLFAIVTHYCFFIGDVKWTTILKAIYTVTKYLLTSLHIRPCSPVCFVKSFLPSILDAISLASSGLLKNYTYQMSTFFGSILVKSIELKKLGQE